MTCPGRSSLPLILGTTKLQTYRICRWQLRASLSGEGSVDKISMNTANVVSGDAEKSARSFHGGWLVALAVQVELSDGTTGKAEAVQQIHLSVPAVIRDGCRHAHRFCSRHIETVVLAW